MTKMILWMLTALMVLPATAAMAQHDVAIIDYVGFGWETGGFLPSDAGDVLQMAAVASALDPMIGVDLLQAEVTIYVSGLVSLGGVSMNGDTLVEYSDGTLLVMADDASNARWGTAPPNATAPSTFEDGDLLFEGTFNDFRIMVSASGAGVFTGSLEAVSGPLLTSCDGCVFTWGGTFNIDAGARLPEGYDVQIDGALEIDRTVPVQQTGWSALKALFEDGRSIR